VTEQLAVLIPVYKNQRGLERSLGSLRGAEGSFSVVIVDDGSPEPISAPSRLRKDVPVKLLRLEENRGIAGALNQGLRYILKRGYSCVGRLDAGDTVVPRRFGRQLAFLEAHPSCGAVSSFVDFVDHNERPLFRYRAPSEHFEILRMLHLNNCIIHPAAMLRASALEEIGAYREDLPGAEDYELFLRMARRYRLAVLPEVLTQVEYAFNGLSIAGRRGQQRSRLKLQLRYFDPASPYSFYGIARTLAAMLVPHSIVFRFKRAYLR
jgi:glycosyltransferase involved in cell wall biosynthesis